jgi:folate-binding protein YgfZ
MRGLIDVPLGTHAMKRSPLLARLSDRGAALATVGEWEVAARVATVADDYAALRRGVGAIDLSHRTILRITGAERAKFLQGILTNDANRLAPGRGLYGAILTAKGKMQADLTVYALADSFWVDAEPEVSDKLFQVLTRYTIGTDATIANDTGARGVIGVYGPRAASALTSAFPGVEAPSAQLAVTEQTWRNHSVTVAESGYPGTPGYKLLLPAAALDAAWAAVLDAGTSAVGIDALEAVRIEAGVPRYGSDMSEENFPPEARIEDRAISYTKGCYMGQETIARIKTYGHVNRLLVGLLPETDRPIAPGAALFHSDITSVLREHKEAGYVTSSIVSPGLKRVIALGYVHRTLATPGTTVSIGAEHPIPATVVALPFTPPA